MSWRVAILPCTIFGEVVTEENDRGADWVIRENATESEITDIAKQCAWRLPLKLFAPSLSDSRLLRLRDLLEDDHNMPDLSYTVLVRPVLK